MPDFQVTAIKKKDRFSSYEGITHLGNTKDEWVLTRAEMIASIESKTNTFYTRVDGNRGNIGVVNGQSGKYVRTYADGRWNDNLLSLPQLP